MDDHAQFYKELMNAATSWVPMAINFICKGERNNIKGTHKHALLENGEGCFHIHKCETPHIPVVYLHTSQ